MPSIKNKYHGTVLFLLLFFLFSCQSAQETKNITTPVDYPFMNIKLTTESRVADLISRLTLEEKMLQLFNESPAIERLGIPAYNWWNEALHGVARAGKATVFPQAIGLASSWDEQLMHDIATAISDEARAKHNYFTEKEIRTVYTGLTFWSPNINIFRDPRWGRGQETYGEDPYLTGKMAVQFIRGLQGDDPKYFKTIATVKHYAVHSGPEVSRHRDNFFINDRDLNETYLPAFKMAVEDANVQSVMCAYNRFRDEPCCGSDQLLQTILRNKFGFNGYVVSDCGGISDFYEKGRHEVANSPSAAWGWALSSGTDLNCESNAAFIRDNLAEALSSGIIKIDEVNKALKRLFTARFKLGLFDPMAVQTYTRIPFSVLGSQDHLKLTEEAAERAMVLLKNDGILPLKPETRIAMIGPNADNMDVLLGNYNGIPFMPSTPLQAFKRSLSPDSFSYSPGCPLIPGIYPFKSAIPSSVLFHKKNGILLQGLEANYYNNIDFSGDPKLNRIDHNIDFQWDKCPINDLYNVDFSIKWTGILKPEKSGKYLFSDQISLKLDGKQITNKAIPLEAGKEYTLEASKVFESFWWANVIAPAVSLKWVDLSDDLQTEAMKIANQADVILFCGGISPRLEGEELGIETEGFSHGDRTHLKLPEVQEALLKKLTELGKPIVFINFSGSAVALNWENENMNAIIQAFYPGEATGTALKNIVYGKSNPSGKLPVTFYRSVNDLPPFNDYNMTGRTYRYFNEDVLYPFGHGLSYSHFSYSDLKMVDEIKAGETFELEFKLTNTGTTDGREIVQLYISDLDSAYPRPFYSLKSFEAVFLKKGESHLIRFNIKAEDLSIYNNDFEQIIEPGTFSIHVGSGMPGSAYLSSDQFVHKKLLVKGSNYTFGTEN